MTPLPDWSIVWPFVGIALALVCILAGGDDPDDPERLGW